MITLFRKYIALNTTNGFYAFGGVTALSAWFAWITNNMLLMGLPFAILLCLLILINFRAAFLLLIFCLPLSIEYEIGSHLATDLPTEPLMLILMLAGWLYLLANPKVLPQGFVKHPILQVLYLHLLWIGVCVICSQFFVVSRFCGTAFIGTKQIAQKAYWCAWVLGCF